MFCAVFLIYRVSVHAQQTKTRTLNLLRLWELENSIAQVVDKKNLEPDYHLLMDV